jgi:hypothetical protein
MEEAYDKQKGILSDVVSEFRSLLGSLKDFSRSLTVGELSKISPEEKYKALGAEVQALLPKVQDRDKDALAKWPSIAEEYLKASEGYNASNDGYFKDLALIKQYTDDAVTYAQAQVDVGQLQLDAMNGNIEATKAVNQSIQQLISAVTGSGSTGTSSGGSMSLVSGYGANVNQMVENYGGLDSLYSGATSGNADSYRNLKMLMDRWTRLQGLDKNSLDMILGGGWYDKIKAIPGFANGGVANGVAMVGERGAELVNFKSPARVYNANDTKSILGGGSNNEETNALLKEQNKLLRALLKQSNDNDGVKVAVLKSVDRRMSNVESNNNFERAGT